MSINEIKEKVKVFLGKYIKNPNLDEDKDFFASGMLNSLVAMQLVLFIEKEFSVKVDNEDLKITNFNTINNIINYIDRKTNKSAA